MPHRELVKKARSAHDHVILKSKSLRQVEPVQALFADDLAAD